MNDIQQKIYYKIQKDKELTDEEIVEIAFDFDLIAESTILNYDTWHATIKVIVKLDNKFYSIIYKQCLDDDDVNEYPFRKFTEVKPVKELTTVWKEVKISKEDIYYKIENKIKLTAEEVELIITEYNEDIVDKKRYFSGSVGTYLKSIIKIKEEYYAIYWRDGTKNLYIPQIVKGTRKKFYWEDYE